MTLDQLEPSGASLVALLGDADREVRLRAVLEVGERREESAATAIVGRFGLERDFRIREALTWAALRIEGSTVPLVLDALRGPSWLGRLQAVHTLSKLGRYDDGPALLPLIDDPIDAVAARAYWAAAQTATRSSSPRSPTGSGAATRPIVTP